VQCRQNIAVSILMSNMRRCRAFQEGGVLWPSPAIRLFWINKGSEMRLKKKQNTAIRQRSEQAAQPNNLPFERLKNTSDQRQTWE
jgi:hypothetical protein